MHPLDSLKGSPDSYEWVLSSAAPLEYMVCIPSKVTNILRNHACIHSDIRACTCSSMHGLFECVAPQEYMVCALATHLQSSLTCMGFELTPPYGHTVQVL